MVGDGHAMGVATEILEHIFRATKGAFRVDHPVFAEQRPQPSDEGCRLSEERQVSMKDELAFTESVLESSNKLAAKNAAKHFDGEKEPVT